MTLVLLVGGARSGKSTLALERAQARGEEVVFIATGEAGDEEMAERIERHRRERPEEWATVEEPLELGRALAVAPANATVIVDCLSLWIANVLELADVEEEAERVARAAAARPGLTIAVTNEVGLGIVPGNALARRYRDVLGRVNAIWAEVADEACFVVAGRTLRLSERRLDGAHPRAEAPALPAPGAGRSAFEEAQRRFDAKTKPRGSLGRLEQLGCELARIRGFVPERLDAAIVVAAGDHGVAAEGVSAYPSEVTTQMVANFAAGGAAVNVLARQVGARLVLVDAGIAHPFEHELVRPVQIGAGTANMANGPAMTGEEVERALAAGEALAAELDVDVVALGEMGIGNTTAASALTAALLDVDPELVCGPGTGLDAAGVAHKVDVVRRAQAVNAGGDRLASFGGFEIAFLAGLAIGCAARDVVVLIDGFITAVAVLAAVRRVPSAGSALVAAHRSPEPGHALVLDALGLEPLLDLDLRLGEGSGAALALPLLHASIAILREMATFGDAGVTDAGR